MTPLFDGSCPVSLVKNRLWVPQDCIGPARRISSVFTGSIPHRREDFSDKVINGGNETALEIVHSFLFRR